MVHTLFDLLLLICIFILRRQRYEFYPLWQNVTAFLFVKGLRTLYYGCCRSDSFVIYFEYTGDYRLCFVIFTG